MKPIHLNRHPEGIPEGSCQLVAGCSNPQPLSVFPLNLGERTSIKVSRLMNDNISK